MLPRRCCPVVIFVAIRLVAQQPSLNEARARAAGEAGNLDGAAEAWKRAASDYDAARQADRRTAALSKLADLYRQQDRFDEAIAEVLRPAADAAATDEARLSAFAQLGQAYVLASRVCRISPDCRGSASQRLAEAAKAYKSAASASHDMSSRIGYLTQAGIAAAGAGQTGEAVATLGQAERLLPAGISQSRIDLAHAFAVTGDYDAVRRVLEPVKTPAGEDEDPRLLSAGNRLVAQISAGEAAAASARRAIFFAQEAGDRHALYAAQWELARVLDKTNQPDAARRVYLLAVDAASQIHSYLALAAREQRLSFREAAGRLFIETADILLRNAARLTGEARQAELKTAFDIVALLQESELTAYFGKDCGAGTRQADTVASLTPGVAILRPVLLKDRIEILFAVRGRMDSYPVLRTDELMADLQSFRQQIEDRTTIGYMIPARRLFRALLAPFLSRTASLAIHTIFVNPDEGLRGVPLAALMDGDEHLGERYAFILSPGFELPHADAPRWRPGVWNRDKLLGASVTKAQCGPPHAWTNVDLPFAGDEVKHAASLYHSKQPLVDDTFGVDGLAARYRGGAYRVVHIAAHAEFRPMAGHSVLYACDGTVGISQLDKLLAPRTLGQQLDLLVLSGCRTAAGDERAALGLGGLAVQAGAAHAIATLWHVSDRGTAEFMNAFYNELRTGASKARALQTAQRHMLRDAWMRHPFYWASFLLIGNAY